VALVDSEFEPSENTASKDDTEEIDVFATHSKENEIVSSDEKVTQPESVPVESPETAPLSTSAEIEQTVTDENSGEHNTDESFQVTQGHSIEDYKEEDDTKQEDPTPVKESTTPVVAQSPASRPSSSKKSLFDDEDDDDLFGKISVKKPTPKKNKLFDDDDDFFGSK
jgi:hypothetical protein